MTQFLVDKKQSSKCQQLLCSLTFAAFFIFVLCFFFPPKWQTNDDIGMSMIAHGYGIAVIGSPNILFSNVLWGYLVRIIPEINGVLGYSVATLSVLVVVGGIVIWTLIQRGIGYVACLSALALILTGPVIFPQFTINAGLLSVGTVLCWQLYAQENNKLALLVGCILAFLGYLVRSLEFFLVLAVALPLIPWRALLLQRLARYAIFTLASLIAISAVIDHQAYQGDEWKSFNELNSARAAFTDYGAGSILKPRSDILERHGFTPNDIDLISQWFFVDSYIADPKILRSMLSELGPLPTQGNALTNAWLGIQTLWHPQLLAVVLAALFLIFLAPTWQTAASWGLCISSIFVLGLLGRPSILRVYIPLINLLLVAPFLVSQISGWRKHLSTAILLLAAFANTGYVFAESKNFNLIAQQVRKDLATFPTFPVVIWGSTFPYDAIYPVLGSSSSAMSYRHYGLGTSTLAPSTVAYTEQKAGRGLTDLLSKEGGIPILAYPAYINMLGIYCKEHLHGQLKLSKQQPYGAIEMSFCQCEIKS